VGRDSWPVGRAAWRSLPVRLAAAVLCLTAAGAAVITAASHQLAQHYLMQQADQQLRSYASLLTSRSFMIFPDAPLAPDVSRPPGSQLGVAVRDSSGQLLITAAPPAPAVAASDGTWLVITEPIHYQPRHIPFVYGAQDSSVLVSSTARPGSLAGTLVIGVDVAGIGRTTGGLARTDLAVGGLAVLLMACAVACVIRRILRPLAQVAQTAEAAAAGDLSGRVPTRATRGSAGRLARSFNHTLSRAEQALAAMTTSEAAARARTERLRQTVADTGQELRRPVAVLRGLAEYYRENRQLTPADTDRLMERVDAETVQLQSLLDQLPLPQPDTPTPGTSAPTASHHPDPRAIS
jgi:two-component system, OmpR family, sensor kinase